MLPEPLGVVLELCLVCPVDVFFVVLPSYRAASRSEFVACHSSPVSPPSLTWPPDQWTPSSPPCSQVVSERVSWLPLVRIRALFKRILRSKALRPHKWFKSTHELTYVIRDVAFAKIVSEVNQPSPARWSMNTAMVLYSVLWLWPSLRQYCSCLIIPPISPSPSQQSTIQARKICKGNSSK